MQKYEQCKKIKSTKPNPNFNKTINLEMLYK